MDNLLLFFIALIPVIWLIVSLGVLKIPGQKACPIALAMTIGLSILVWQMPVLDSLTAALEGAAMAIWPIFLVIIAAVFTYNLVTHTGGMETIKKMMSSVSTDQRILVLILAWGFGGFLEAIAGFGTAVAIPASILAALGFNPVFAAIICLIANTTPTAFGAIGLPVSTLASVTGLNVNDLSFTIAIQLFVMIVIIPFILVSITGKSVKAIKGVFLITLMAGLSFGLPQIFVAKYLGAELPAIVGSVICMAVVITMAKVFYKDTAAKNIEKIPLKTAVMAWLPFILVFAIIILCSSLFPAINGLLKQVSTTVQIYTGPHGKPMTFYWLATPGTLIIIATYLGGLIQGVKFGAISTILGKTVKQMFKSAITIMSIVALAKVMGYSGMIGVIAQILVLVTGDFYPLIAPLIGALGTFVTGSDTSANVLFGGLQVEAANAIGMSPYWLAAANTAGATAGKMISPQSIAVATAATGIIGSEGKILQATMKVCAVYVIIIGLVVYFGAPLIVGLLSTFG
ncbi:L-lactate permease [Acetobacterium wieringae]|uniref:L-lactate permease n=1 Tax=Acetobacterium wieringae TaxID=52694 RepID=A0A5D0WI80_9FIRM|nr:L-lactate permease [Acetobacterium wieringae]MEA4805404.1 L-lactate permease [Acetobacterium wieringae]TYC83909.1 L-lactate permease [Acetobacterium wieringae]UYO62198.1 L-lactate permease [Acetobacterium wieringae]VUZ26076.1 L-lactate permease [Acetobacterium wieringae]